MIKTLSYNIRYKDDHLGYKVKNRAPRLRHAVEKYDPDVIGFQEYTPIWEAYINAETYPEYDMFLQYRDDVDEIEGLQILWKRDKFQLIDKGHFWLSDTPDVKSKGWDKLYNCYRICVYVKLRCLENDKIFVFANTHFGFGVEYQVKSAQLIRDYLHSEIEGWPFILVGDFNTRMESAAYKELTSIFTDVNATTTQDYDVTYHGYYKVPKDGMCHIDYCFANDKVKPISQTVIRDKVRFRHISDHYGLYDEVEI